MSMRLRLRDWQPRQLLTAWIVYWIGLVVVGIGSALPIMWRMTRPDAKGSANVSFGDAGFLATISEGAKVTWQASVSLTTLSFLVAIPPLVLWLLWLMSQRGRLPTPGSLPEGSVDPIATRAREREERR
jgi:hypothetical protein